MSLWGATRVAVVRLFPGLVNQESHDEDSQSEQHVTNLVAVFRGEDVDVIGRLEVGELVDAVTDSGEHRVPKAGPERRVEQEGAHLHAGQTGGDRDELAHGRDEAAEESGRSAVLLEVFFGVADFFFVDKAHVADAAVGEAVDNGAAQPQSQIIVEKGADVGLRLDIYKCLELLKPEERLCVTLQLVEGQTIERVAEITGMPQGTVKSHLARGKSRLAKYLKENGYD